MTIDEKIQFDSKNPKSSYNFFSTLIILRRIRKKKFATIDGIIPKLREFLCWNLEHR